MLFGRQLVFSDRTRDYHGRGMEAAQKTVSAAASSNHTSKWSY